MLKESGITRPPVPINRIAKLRGLDIRKDKIPDSDISGFLFRRGVETIIGVNTSHPSTRQRFTIAHELGHVLLHESRPDELHVDRRFEVKFRDSRSSLGTDIEEREANLFAAELLMPQRFIERDLRNASAVDLEDGAFVDKLAAQYGVSSQALIFRLSYLGFVRT